MKVNYQSCERYFRFRAAVTINKAEHTEFTNYCDINMVSPLKLFMPLDLHLIYHARFTHLNRFISELVRKVQGYISQYIVHNHDN